MAYLTSAAFDPAEALRDFQSGLNDAGAVVSFAGYVRATSAQGAVLSLHLQAHPTLTERGIADAIEAAHTRWPLLGHVVMHRIGDMAPGDAIVLVIVAAKHRRAAFEACDFLMDYLKTDAVFWKKETTASGATWIEPRDADYADRARWAAREGAQ
ncbi:MAG: molybdenum cofactor biosynthesis protein MoaE [Alphaproteobacteria bacterium]|nr:molybdenum cofactor biosynthesis protein MoaE [Alphaproteobacteria bacterium]